LQVDNPAAQNALRFMRETQFYASEDYETDNENAARSPDDMKREYVLPDGREVSVAGERFRVPELLFKPESQGYFDCKEKLGLADRVVAAVAGCAESIQVPPGT
jgi:hypothetical protein